MEGKTIHATRFQNIDTCVQYLRSDKSKYSLFSSSQSIVALSLSLKNIRMTHICNSKNKYDTVLHHPRSILSSNFIDMAWSIERLQMKAENSSFSFSSHHNLHCIYFIGVSYGVSISFLICCYAFAFLSS